MSIFRSARVHRQDVNFWQPSSATFDHFDLIYVKNYLGDWHFGQLSIHVFRIAIQHRVSNIGTKEMIFIVMNSLMTMYAVEAVT